MRPKLIIADLPRSHLFLFSTLLLALSTPPCPGKRKAHFVWRKPGTYPPPSTDKFFGNCPCGPLPTETVSARSRPRFSRILVGRSYRYFDCTLYATSWFITTLDKRKSSCDLYSTSLTSNPSRLYPERVALWSASYPPPLPSFYRIVADLIY